jgi:hypothetical protein
MTAATPEEVAGVQDGDESCTVLLQGRKEVALQCSGSEDDGSGLARLDEEWGGEGRCRGHCSAGIGARPWLRLGMAGVAPAHRRQQQASSKAAALA